LLLGFGLLLHRLVRNSHTALVSMKDRTVIPHVSRYPRQTFRTPNQQLPIILRQLIIRRIIQRPSRTVVSAEMAKAAAGVPVLWESVLGILRVRFSVGRRDEGYASLRADPRADSAASTFFHVEDVAASEPFRK